MTDKRLKLVTSIGAESNNLTSTKTVMYIARYKHLFIYCITKFI